MMPMALAWCFLCSLATCLADLVLTFMVPLLVQSFLYENINTNINSDTFDKEPNLIGFQGRQSDGMFFSGFLSVTSQLLSRLVVYLTINLVCLYTKYLIDLAQRNAFLETRRSIETRAKIERENDKQERLLLSLLPRFVALEIIADIAKEDNHDKLLKNQFHKIYIHSYTSVR